MRQQAVVAEDQSEASKLAGVKDASFARFPWLVLFEAWRQEWGQQSRAEENQEKRSKASWVVTKSTAGSSHGLISLWTQETWVNKSFRINDFLYSRGIDGLGGQLLPPPGEGGPVWRTTPADPLYRPGDMTSRAEAEITLMLEWEIPVAKLAGQTWSTSTHNCWDKEGVVKY